MFKFGEKGITHLLILLVVLGVIVFIAITNTASFKNKTFNSLILKDPSYAASTTTQESKFNFLFIPIGYPANQTSRGGQFDNDAITLENRILRTNPYDGYYRAGKFTFYGQFGNTNNFGCYIDNLTQAKNLMLCNQDKIYEFLQSLSVKMDAVILVAAYSGRAWSPSGYKSIVYLPKNGTFGGEANILIHELGHAIGNLMEEYVNDNAFGTKYLTTPPNANCFTAYQADGLRAQGKQVWPGCTVSWFFRTSNNSIMNSDLSDTGSYNDISIEYIKKALDNILAGGSGGVTHGGVSPSGCQTNCTALRQCNVTSVPSTTVFSPLAISSSRRMRADYYPNVSWLTGDADVIKHIDWYEINWNTGKVVISNSIVGGSFQYKGFAVPGSTAFIEQTNVFRAIKPATTVIGAHMYLTYAGTNTQKIDLARKSHAYCSQWLEVVTSIPKPTATPVPPPPAPTPTAVPDAFAPVVKLLSPIDGSQISGKVGIWVNASDNKGIDHIDLYFSNLKKGTFTGNNYVWDSTSYTANTGVRQIFVKAYDASGNVTTSNVVNVTMMGFKPFSQTGGVSVSAIPGCEGIKPYVDIYWNPSTTDGVDYQIGKKGGGLPVPDPNLGVIIGGSAMQSFRDYGEAYPGYTNYPLIATNQYLYTIKAYNSSSSYYFQAANYVTLPACTTVSLSKTSSNLNISWDGNHSATAKDWLGIYYPVGSDQSRINWVYTNSCSKVSAASGVRTGSCSIPIPTTDLAGNAVNLANKLIEVRYFANDWYNYLGSSNVIVP